MKKILTFISAFSLISCGMESGPRENQEVFGTWVLVETSGQMVDSQKRGEEMPFQETYELNQDGTFVKTRVEDGRKQQVTGTFKISETPVGTDIPEKEEFIELEHNSENTLIANCTATLIERLTFISEDRVQSSWFACDGLGLVYEKRE